MTVNNVAPTISNIAVERNLKEGIAATFSATATNNGNDTLTYTWNFGDGSNPVTGQTVSHTFADNGTYTAMLTVTDSMGASVVQTLPLNVNNVAPTAQALDDFAVNEGTAISVNGSFTDPGILDTHSIKWDFGDGTILEYTDTLPHSPTLPLPPSSYLNPTHTWTNNGNYTVTFTVTDNDGGVSSDTVSVRVNNVAPTITNLSGDTTLNSGATANFRASATDRGNDTLIYTWDFGDGSEVATGQNSSHIFTKAGTYTVTLTVVDSDGASTQETLTVNVNNHAVPLITDIPVPKKVYQNDPVAFTASVSAADDATLTYQWNFGDGTQQVVGISPTHVFAQSGEYTATLTVIDATGASDTKTVTVYVGSTSPSTDLDEMDFPDGSPEFDEIFGELEDFDEIWS
ncbi:PKD domain-containing protein [Scytonema sp. NUACC21]